ncbi:MAG: SoxR reducing system RseC family protein [Methylotenera sp.]|nr:SoxR reducing system RseC family protein [Methylotenera sp.]
MIEEYAVVVEKKGAQVILEIERRTACGLCGQKRGCGNATWGKLLGHSSHRVTAENLVNATVGDSVIVGIDEHAVLHSAFYLYVVPLIGLFVGTVLSDYFFSNELYVVIGATAGLLMGFLWVKRHLIGHNKSGVAYGKKYQAVILRFADGDLGVEISSADPKVRVAVVD